MRICEVGEQVLECLRCEFVRVILQLKSGFVISQQLASLNLEETVRMATVEPEINLREGLERVCAEAVKNMRHYNDLEVKLRQKCAELEGEKMAREGTEEQIALLELAVETASDNLRLEKQHLQEAEEQTLLRESQLRGIYSAVAKEQHLFHDHFSTILKTYAIGGSCDDQNETGVPSCQGATNIIAEGDAEEFPVNKDEVALDDVILNTHWLQDLSPEILSSNRGGSELLQNSFGILTLDRDPQGPERRSAPLHPDGDVEPSGQVPFPSEKAPILSVEDVPDLVDCDESHHHSAAREDCWSTRSTSLSDTYGRANYTSNQCEVIATSGEGMSWIVGDMTMIIAELRASNSIIFSKVLSRTYLAKRRRQQLYLPASFIKLHGDKIKNWVDLVTQTSERKWRVRMCSVNRSNGSKQTQIWRGWDEFISDNFLKSGDSLVFVLHDAKSCFQVYIFRKTRRQLD